MRTKLLLLTGPALAFGALIALHFVACFRIAERDYAQSIAWSRHAAAIHALNTRTLDFVTCLETRLEGGCRTERAALESARAQSSALSRGFSLEEQEDERRLGFAIEALIDHAARIEGDLPAEARSGALYFEYRNAVSPLIDERVDEEESGSIHWAAAAHEQLRRGAIEGAIGLLASLVLLLALSVAIARRIVTRLVDLAGHANRFATGDLEAFAFGGNDELTRLAGSFNDMARALRSSTISATRLEEAVANRTQQLEKSLDALRDSRSRLMLAERMATVGTLAAGVAHEINNPLSFVTANLFFALEETRAGTDWRRAEVATALEDATHGAERIRDIVRDLKTFSRPDEESTSIDVHKVVDLSLAMAANEIKHRARVVKRYGDALPPVLGNQGRLGQALLNLLVNAAQAIPAGAVERNEIRVVTYVEGGNVCVEVHDTGSGIPPDVIGRVFDPFFTTKPVGSGTGLGLSITRNIVDSMNGEISVWSEAGAGTTFRLSIPAAPVAAEVQHPRAAVSTARLRILIVDDEPLVGAALRRTLPQHEVIPVQSGREGLARLRNEDFDVVLCDLMMPEMDGREFHRNATSMAGRIVFITGGAFTREAQEFLSDRPHLEKPLDPLKLQRVLASIGPRPATASETGTTAVRAS